MSARLVGARCVSATGAECERSIVGATRDRELRVFRDVERAGREGRAEVRREEGREGTRIVRPIVTEGTGAGEGDSDGGGVAIAEGVSMSISPVEPSWASSGCGRSTWEVGVGGLGCSVAADATRLARKCSPESSTSTSSEGESSPKSSTSSDPWTIYVHVILARD